MDILLSSDALDLSFHPSDSTNLLALGLISGKVQLINYDEYIASTSEPSASTAPPLAKKIRTAHDSTTPKRYVKVWNTRPSRKSCRGLHFDNEDGRGIYSISKDKALFLTDTETGKVRSSWLNSHESAPSRVLPIDATMVVTGDDEGVVRVWDPRKPGTAKPVRQYDHHFDWITDMLYMPYLPEKRRLATRADGLKQSKKELQNKAKKERKKARKAEYQRQAAAAAAAAEEQHGDDESDFDSEASDDDGPQRGGAGAGRSRLVVTSGDGSLSSIDLRAAGPSAFEVSEDQEDELLCVTALKNSSKLVVGTQMGILSLWAPRRGLLDHVDRVPGHPASVDTLCTLDQDTVLTGSSDGLVRVVQILPSKLLGVIADHDGLPIERMKRKLATLATIGHSNSVKFTDLTPLLNDDDDDELDQDAEESDSDDASPLGLVDRQAAHDASDDSQDDESDTDPPSGVEAPAAPSDDDSDDNDNSDSDDDDSSPPPPPPPPPSKTKRGKARPTSNSHTDTTAFFSEL